MVLMVIHSDAELQQSARADRIGPALAVVAPYQEVVAPYQEVGFYRAICFCSSFVSSSFSEHP